MGIFLRFPAAGLACLPLLACTVLVKRPGWQPIRPRPLPATHLAFSVGYESAGGRPAPREAEWARLATLRILAERGIDAEYVSDASKADWILRFRERPVPEAFQDWLTGLSLGWIPSFKVGTGLEMHFADTRTGIRMAYPVRSLLVSHLFLAPLSVLQLAACLGHPKGPGILVYRMALEDFLARNYREPGTTPLPPDIPAH